VGAVSRHARVASAAVAAVLAAAAGLAFQRVFPWRDLVPVIGAAAALPAALSLALSARRPRPLWQALVLTVAGWLLVVSVTLFRGAPGGLPTGVAVDALRDSWKGILTTILPAPGRPDLLVLPHALVWAAAFAGVELALRSRAVLAPAVPAVAVLIAALLFGVDGTGPILPVVAVVAGLAGLLALVRAGTFGSARTLALALPAVACLAAAAAAIGPSLPFVQARPPFDLRDHVSPPPPDLGQAVSPLDEVSAWLQQPDTPLFTVRAASAQDWRLAALERYDGTTWSPSATFVPAGSRVPRSPASAGPAASEAVDQRITIQGLPGVWLPAATRPSTIAGVGVYVDPPSGVLVAAAPLRAGLSYDVVSAVPRFSRRELESATPASGAAAAAELALPGAGAGSAVPEPAEMQRFALQAVAGAGSPYQQAVQLADYLRANDVYDVTAPPGHAYRTLEFFMATSHRGTSEQFASTYALMARTLGLPSRVVVGFRSGSLAGGTWQVRAGDVLVWPEIDFRGIGWVPFYPTPDQTGATTQTQTVAAGQSAARQAIDQQIAAASPPPPAAPPVHRQPPHPAAGPSPWNLAPLLGLPVLAYGALVIGVPRWRRSRRRRRASPAGRVVGAWHEALDGLSGLGLPPVRTLSARDVARFGVTAMGPAAADHLVPLAEAADWAGFAAEPPDEAAAEAAWRHSDAVRRLVRATMRWPARLRRGAGPRALWPG
jgi:transglutaminase-like putative cysteine protease